MATLKCLCPYPRIPCYGLKGFNVLQFVPPVPKALAEIKRTIYNALGPLILQFELLHDVFKNKIYYWLGYHIYYSSNNGMKRIDRPEVIGIAKGGWGRTLSTLNANNDKRNDSKAYCSINFSLLLFLAFSRATVINNNIIMLTTRVAGAPQFNFFQSI